MSATPMIDGIEFPQAQYLNALQTEVFHRHDTATLEGDFLQDLGRRATRVRLSGVLSGPKALTAMIMLRSKFRRANVVSFVSDITSATRVKQMLIEELTFGEAAGKPDRFEYAFTLVEAAGTKASGAGQLPRTAAVPPVRSVEAGSLAADVIAPGGTLVRNALVVARREKDSGGTFDRFLNSRHGTHWNNEALEPGRYRVFAATGTPALSGWTLATVHAGQTARVTVRVEAGRTVARSFWVHFSPKTAFLEPAMHLPLMAAAEYARAHPAEKLFIFAHVDPVSDGPLADGIAGERAELVCSLFTSSSEKDASRHWDAVRKKTAAQPARAWGKREYQHILRYLGYFVGQIDREPKLARNGLRDFQLDHGLTPTAVADDDTWAALLAVYLEKLRAIALPQTSLLKPPHTSTGTRGAVRNTSAGSRPNRRVDLLFVDAKADPKGLAEWEVLPTEQDLITVRGSLSHPNGTPLSGIPYVLVAPDGEYMDGEQSNGLAIPGVSATDGTFSYSKKPKTSGFYTIELMGPFVAWLRDQPRSTARGPQVVTRLSSSSSFDVIAIRRGKG